MAPTAIITINLCDCSEHGDCLFGERAEGQTSGSNFRIVGCKCKIGYTGTLLDSVKMIVLFYEKIVMF